MRQLHRWVLVASWMACGEPAAPEAPPPPPLIHPLAEAPVAPWLQQVWFAGRPGERVEYLVLSEGAQPSPLVGLVAPDGTRRALRLLDAEHQEPVEASARPQARESQTVSSPDGALRVSIAREAQTTITVTDARTGARNVVVRDIGGREIRNPDVDSIGNAIYLDVGGNLGGVFRIGLADGLPVRIVPEVQAGSPRAWRDERGERIVYVEDGPVPRVVVARPGGDLPTRPAANMVAERRIPATLVPIVVTVDGKPVRLDTCEPAPPLTLLGADGSVHLGSTRIDEGRYCGRGCTELLGRSPEGAPRLVGALGLDPITNVWTVWLDPELGITQRAWMEPERAATALAVPACFPKRDPALWLVEPRLLAPPGETYTHMSSSSDMLEVMGRKGGRSFVVTLTPRRAALQRALLNPRPPPEPTALASDGSARAAIQGGDLVWTEVATGVTSVVLKGGERHVLVEPAFGEGDAALFVADEGPEPGLLRVVLSQGKLEHIVRGPGVHRPYPLRWDGVDRVGFLQVTDKVWTMSTARPFDAVAAAAWDEGPITLTDFEPVWLPVETQEGQLVRCQSGDVIRLGLDAQGGYLSWGGARHGARAAAWDGSSLRVLEDVGGVPTLVAELRQEPDGGRWWPLAIPVQAGATRWLAEPEAKRLPEGRACNPRKE